MTRQWLLNAFVLNTTILMDPVSLVSARRSGDNLLSRDQNALSFLAGNPLASTRSRSMHISILEPVACALSMVIMILLYYNYNIYI